jgi:CDP-2,3-bis-(O-geranylgeranyl)-sn-glycerol synthase
MFSQELFFLIIAYAVPMYIANASPIILHGKKPLDFGKSFFGKRFLGDGKTILGTLIGILFGTLAGFLFALFYNNIFILIPNYLLLSFLLAFGAITGDIIESFLKRRFGFKSGQKCFLFDQIDFILGGLLFSLIILFPRIEIIIILFFATIFIHSGTNVIAFKLGLKKVPW